MSFLLILSNFQVIFVYTAMIKNSAQCTNYTCALKIDKWSQIYVFATTVLVTQPTIDLKYSITYIYL